MKLSIIGAAQIVSQYHIHALKKLDNVFIDYVVDIDIDAASRVSKVCAAKPSTEILDVLNSDIVFIAAPPSARPKILEKLKTFSGVIVMEKPAAMGIVDFNELLDFANSRSEPVYIAQTRRYFLNLQTLNNLVGAGLVGSLREVSIYEGGIFNWVSNSNHLSAKDKKNLDKGVLQDVGSHILDYLSCLCERLDVSLDDFSLINVDADFIDLTNDLKFSLDGPFLINVHLSRSGTLANRISIHGELGNVSTRSLLDDTLRVLDSEDKESFIKTHWNKSEYTLESAFIAMWKDLLDVKENQSKLRANIGQLESSMKIMQSIINRINS